MSDSNSGLRPLSKKVDVENFLKNALHLDYLNIAPLRNIVSRIVDSELGVAHYFDAQTMDDKLMRDERYRTEESRWKLRERIITELLTKKRLENDEKIKLNSGGALPRCELRSEKQAFIVIGLPASGKSGISTQIAEQYGAYIIDSDFAKRKIPEFHDHQYGASIVHEESKQITFGFENPPHDLKSFYLECIDQGHNIVIPRIGNSPVSIIELATALMEREYETHLILISLSKKEATTRAVFRYAYTDRYVPLALIFDQYGNDPSHCYYYLRCKKPDMFKSFGAISTLNKSPECIDSVGDSPALRYDTNETILKLP